MERSLYVHSKGKVSNFCKKSTKKFFILNTRCCQWYWKPDIEENWPNLGWVKFFFLASTNPLEHFPKSHFQLPHIFLFSWDNWKSFSINYNLIGSSGCSFLLIGFLQYCPSFCYLLKGNLIWIYFSTFLQVWFHRLQKWCSWYYRFTSLWQVFKWRKRILSFEKFCDETDDIAQ